MKFYSTNNKNNVATMREAVLGGLSPDGGLYMPEYIPRLDSSFFEKISSMSFQEISLSVAEKFFQDDVPLEKLKNIIQDAFTFDIPLVTLGDSAYILELFHGPTLAFKDFGARFMARLISFFLHKTNQELTILVATSGDTGSAVASGFYQVQGIRVVILYPSKKVSELQEKQLTTMGANIISLEVEGTFDDCQRLVKEAFRDEELRGNITLTSANSINIARLLPQSFYYFYAYAQLPDKNLPIVFSVPCGNFGNLTAGLIAKKMGLPVARFIASTNINDVVPEYLRTGIFTPRPSRETYSNAMDVGNPSNFVRMQELYNYNVDKMKQDISGFNFSDAETIETIREVWKKFQYTLDPHGAIGYRGLKSYLSQTTLPINGIVLETAHPAKFISTIEQALKRPIKIPARLEEYLNKEKKATNISSEYIELKNFLMNYLGAEPTRYQVDANLI